MLHNNSRSYTTLLLVVSVLVKISTAIIPLFSRDELKYTFGVHKLNEVPSYKEVFPKLFYSSDGQLERLMIRIDDKQLNLTLKQVTPSLLSPFWMRIHRNGDKVSHLNVGEQITHCHYQHHGNGTYAAISTCENIIKGTIIKADGIHIIHPYPQRYMHLFSSKSEGSNGAHVIFKREIPQTDFCAIESAGISSSELEEETGIHEDVRVSAQKLQEMGDLVVELAVFVDEVLWQHFKQKYGQQSHKELENYVITVLNNIQIMYEQPSAAPPLKFHAVRLEILESQPSALSSANHDSGNAQRYLDVFCKYQKQLSGRNWDHAILLTGYDIHRGSGSRSISGIARLSGMCDSWNTCTVAEGLDFTSAFIGSHEIGHSLGMRHDEPYCASRYIMSQTLGAGKVTWSACSMRDFQNFLRVLDSKSRNCLRTSNLPQKLTMRTDVKPGQIYDADYQCRLTHGDKYLKVEPRSDNYNGLCYMMWCGLSKFGRIVTSHPALEGTRCGESKWCEQGKCVAYHSYAKLKEINGQWSSWSPTTCSSCACPDIENSVGVSINRRTCSNPPPSNGGAECVGGSVQGIVCERKCAKARLTVDQYITQICSEHKRRNNDPDLTGTGTQLLRYHTRACKVFCHLSLKNDKERSYRFFGDNLPNGSPCSENKYCLEGECIQLSCNFNALITRDLSCPKDTCPSVIVYDRSKNSWSVWSSWSYCSKSCGGGNRMRLRACNGYSCQGTKTEYMPCNEDSCTNLSSTNSWSEWTLWNQCSVTCGRGAQARYRKCLTKSSGVSKCTGQSAEIRRCMLEECGPSKVGLWSSWSAWSLCSATCGPGNQLSYRYCSKEPCDGSGQSRKSCNLQPCSVKSQVWSQWSDWATCSKPCGTGLMIRRRTCSGNDCVGSSVDQQFCNRQPCSAQSGQWSSWSDWSTCSVTCGAGSNRRTRQCIAGNCVGSHQGIMFCEYKTCSVVNASWGGWGYWSVCSTKCGNGTRKRVRKCYNLASSSSNACSGSEYERQACQSSNGC